MGTNKPDERLYCWFEEKFNLSSCVLVYIADNPAKDFIGANQRGWLTVRVLTGEHTEVQVPVPYRAKSSIKHVREMDNWLQKTHLSSFKPPKFHVQCD